MKKYWPVIFILACAFLFYFPSLDLYFAADDFFYTSFLDIKQTFMFFPGLYHYSPVFWFLMYLMRTFSGLNPLPYHLLAVILHLLCIFLVYLLTLKLFKNTLSAFFCAILYAFFFSHYEVVYWVTGIDTSLLAVFYTGGLYAYLKFTENRKPGFLNLYNLLTVLALLTHEYAVSLPVAAFFYDTVAVRKMKIGRVFLYQFPVLLFTAGLFLFKAVFSQAALTVTPFSPGRFLASIAKSLVYLSVPVPQIFDNLPKIVLVLFSGVIMIFYFRLRKDKIINWLLLWLFTTILLFSATSVPQARYFYLSAVPAVMLIVKILNINLHSGRIYPKLGFIFLILLCGILFLKKQESYWFISSQILYSTVAHVREQLSQNSKSGELLFLNLPDSVNGPPWNVYVFRGGLERVLENNGIVFTKIKYGRTVKLNGILRDDPLYTWEIVGDYHNAGTPVFIYDEKMRTVRRIDNGTEESI